MLEEAVDLARVPVILVWFCVIVPVSVCLVHKTDTVPIDFSAYRVQHFDLQGSPHGSRAWRVSFEAVSLGARTLLRRCLVVWWRDLAGRQLSDLMDKTLGAAVIIIPNDIDGLSSQDMEALTDLETQLVSESFDLPVFLAPSTPELQHCMNSLHKTHTSEQQSAFAALLDALMANAYQFVSNNQASAAKNDQTMYNIVGKLSAYERNADVPTVAVVAHYDSFGGAPTLSYGADSNGSGVAALFELIRILHKLYQTAKTRARYNLVFVLSAGGKLNYQGSRHWIEEQWESTEGVAQQLEFALCLDSLGSGSTLNMHVSKAPREDSSAHRFYEELEKAAANHNRTINMVSKKINLGEELLAWEHERYSIRRLPAFTVSRHSNHKDSMRRSIMDTRSRLNMEALSENVATIADALVMFLFDLPANQNQKDTLLGTQDGVRVELLEGWLDLLTSQPRSAQLLANQGIKNPLVVDLLNAMDHHSHEAHTTPVAIDKKDPEYMLYGITEDTIQAFRVKPAVFDLLLALGIVAYLFGIYFAVLNINLVLNFLHTQLVKMKIKTA